MICNGWGMGETHLGAYAEKARVKGDWLVRLPEGMSTRDAMAIGTAGYTAMLSVLALEKHGLTPKQRPGVVTGAAGGVGSVAIAVLSKLGYHVIASTGRMAEADYLKGLGAAEVIDRNELSGPAKPLAKERWAAGIDSVGSTTLANVLSMTKYGGAVAACGLAAGMDLPTSVAPFILRGVCLLGIDSVMCPIESRERPPGAGWRPIWIRQNLLKLLMKSVLTRSSARAPRSWPARSAAGSWSKFCNGVQTLPTNLLQCCHGWYGKQRVKRASAE